MKKIIILLICSLTCFGQLIWAQKHSSPEKRAQLLTQIMNSRIPLRDSTEYQQVFAINLKYAQLIQGQLSKNNNKRIAIRKVRELHLARENEFRLLFDYDQMRNYEVLKKELIRKVKTYHQNK